MMCLVLAFQANSLLFLEPQVYFLTLIHLGAGKTTLLNFLSGREFSKSLTKTGVVVCNGVDKNKISNFSAVSAYVQ